MSIELKNVSAKYVDAGDKAKDGAVHALKDVSLSIVSGESVAVIGPSGCGKTTLLKVMCGLVQPSVGEVVFGGEEQHPTTAFIQQNYGLLPWFNVQKNVELGLEIQRVPKRERAQCTSKRGRGEGEPKREQTRRVPKLERTRRVKEALKTVGLQDFARAYPSQLSGGMQQRVAIARAVAMDAQLLLMDEPLSALDPALREELQDVLFRFWAMHRYTQVIVTHSIEEAVYLGQRIVVVAQQPGRVSAVIDNSDASHFIRILEGTDASEVVQFRKSEEFFERCRRVYMAFEAAVEDKTKDKIEDKVKDKTNDKAESGSEL